MNPARTTIILCDFEMKVKRCGRAAEIIRDIPNMLAGLDWVPRLYLQLVHVHVHVFEDAAASAQIHVVGADM